MSASLDNMLVRGHVYRGAVVWTRLQSPVSFERLASALEFLEIWHAPFPKRQRTNFIYWPFSLGAILAKYLDVCETTATTTHILQTTSRVLINIVLNWGQSVGGLHRQGVYYAVCREQERELVTVTTTEQREAPGATWETWLVVVPWMWINFHCQHWPCWALRHSSVFMWEGAVYMGGAFRMRLPVLAATCLKCFTSRQFIAIEEGRSNESLQNLQRSIIAQSHDWMTYKWLLNPQRHMPFHLKELDFDSWQTFGQYRQ